MEKFSDCSDLFSHTITFIVYWLKITLKNTVHFNGFSLYQYALVQLSFPISL